MSSPSPRASYLPFRAWWPPAIGAVAGVALRLAFSGQPGGAFAAMSASFIYFVPILVGAVTVYFAERKARQTWGYYFLAGAGANVLFVLGTMAILIEGLICAVLIVPLFAILGGVGGLIMGAVCRTTRWPRHMAMSLGVLPLMLAPLEARLPVPDRLDVVERVIRVDAKPEQVWQRIVDTGEIRPEDLRHAWVFRIGVPLPLRGQTRDTGEVKVRRVTMGKQIYFDEVVTEWEPYRRLTWRYRFYKDSFPPHALDDHVRLGGQYFDLLETTYTFTAVADGSEVKVRLVYRLSTRFNWYADPLARLLLGDMADANLGYYARRAVLR